MLPSKPPAKDKKQQPEAVEINRVLQEAKKVLVVGYSPTGGGHTARTFGIIDQAFEDKHLAAEDVVIFHCPPAWGAQQNKELDNIVRKLKERGIQVVLAAADKTIYGHLKPEGSSDDPRILAEFAKYPTRKHSPHEDVSECAILWTSLDSSPTEHIILNKDERNKHLISAKNLLGSLAKHVDVSKLFVLTDMDPYLQKAARGAKILSEHCLDQQNHAILLGELYQPDVTAPAVKAPAASDAKELKTRVHEEPDMSSNAFLAKVLCGSGGKVSHIGLGEKNTLRGAMGSAKLLGVESKEIKGESKFTTEVSQATARKNLIKLLFEKGKIINKDEIYNKSVPGVMMKSDLKAEEVKDVVYLYAHNYTPKLGEHIRQKINENAEGYSDTMFLFCGAGAIKGEYNALHLAYVAGAHGITTAGAGTNGEFAYLHKSGGDTSQLLVLPIAGHNEQAANASYLAKAFSGYVSVIDDEKQKQGQIEASLDAFVDRATTTPRPPSFEQPMNSFVNAISQVDTYAKQASSLLFDEKTYGAKTVFDKIKIIEEQMRKDPNLKGNRRYIKAVFQVLEQLKEHIQNGYDLFPINIQLTQKNKPCSLGNIDQVISFFDKANLKKLLETQGIEMGKSDFIMHENIMKFFTQCKSRVPEIKQIDQIEEQFGHRLTTGF